LEKKFFPPPKKKFGGPPCFPPPGGAPGKLCWGGDLGITGQNNPHIVQKNPGQFGEKKPIFWGKNGFPPNLFSPPFYPSPGPKIPPSPQQKFPFPPGQKNFSQKKNWPPPPLPQRGVKWKKKINNGGGKKFPFPLENQEKFYFLKRPSGKKYPPNQPRPKKKNREKFF